MSPMTKYRGGYEFEKRVAAALERDGYACVEARGSHGAADIIAMKPGQTLLVQAKRRNPLLPPAERVKLYELAQRLKVPAIVAYQPAPRKPIAYRRLVGTGPKDFVEWTPDFATQKEAQ